MPLIKARSSSIINSVDLRGTPTAPTAAAGTNTTQLASTAFVSGAVSDLVASAPAVLDTLSELATALGNDADFATTVASSIATKLSLSGDTMTGALILSGDPTADLQAATKGYVDGLINAQMIYSTDDVDEGVTNLYYQDSRVRAAVSLTSDNTTVLNYNSVTGEFTYNHPTSDGILEGSTNLYYSDSRVRNAISLNSDDNQIFGYGSSTGEFTFTTPDTDKIVEGSINLYFTTSRARNSISAGANISYDPATGIISSTSAVDSVNGQTGVVVLDTDNIDEGSANLYFTDTRARAAVSLTTSDPNTLGYNSSTGVFTYVKPNSDGIAEGSTNLYFTNARARDAISTTGDLTYNSATGVLGFSLGNHDTDDLAEGAVNQYFTSTRARDAITLSTDNATILSYNGTTGAFTYTTPDTDKIAEGSNNLYFTDARARDAISVTGDLEYNAATGIINYDTPTSDGVFEGTINLYFTDSRAQAAISVVDAGGDGSLTYNSSNGVITYTGPSASEVRAHFSAQTASGINVNAGEFYLSAIPNASLANDSVTFNGVEVVLGGSGTLDTDDIGEGTTNKYWTEARFDASFALKDTDDLTEGASQLYFTNARARDAISVDNDNTGNAYGLGDSIAYDSATGVITYTSPSISELRTIISGGTGVTYTASTGVIEIGQAVGTTDNVTFNDVTVSGDLTINGTLTTINSTDLAVTDKNITIADGAVNAAAADGAGITVDGANATITYASGTDSWNVNKDFNVNGDLSTTGSLSAAGFTGDLTGNVTGNVTGQVSDISNHDTDALAEGTTNLYFTDERVDDRVADLLVAGDNITLTYSDVNGTLTVDGPTNTTEISEGTNLYYTDARARAAVSVSDAGGDGSLAYDSATGVITYTGPSASEVRAHFSAITGTGVSYDAGSFFLADIPNSSLTNSSITVNGATIALGGSATLDTGDVAEGSNLYFTDARARNAISLTTSDSTVLSYDSVTGEFTFDLAGIDTDEVTEGTTNLYFTTQRARDSISVSGDLTYDASTGVIGFALSNHNTDDLSEGTTNKYYTDTRVRNAISLTTDNTDAMDYDATTGVFTFSLATVDTDEIAEGATNFYFTTQRARDSISGGANINYDAATGIISTLAAVQSVNGLDGVVVLDTDNIDEGSSNLYFTQARARSAVALSSDNTDILSYSSATGTFTFVTPTTDAIAEGAVNQYYTDARADARIAAASVFDLSDVNSGAMTDGYTLVWSAAEQAFVPQNIAVTATTLNFTGDGSTLSFNTGVEVSSIDNTQVFINGLIQAPTYSYTLDTVDGETSIVFDAAPEANDYIFIRVSSTSSLTAGGVLNESSSIDGGTF